MSPFAKIVAAAAACILPAQAGLAQTIGRAVSVVPNAQVGDRELAIGDQLVQNARVRTEPKGSARIRFLDDTVLTVGPSATIVLDQAVFDADRARSVVLTVSGGALRFVTGASSRSAYQVGTPVATIGVRGTILDLVVSGSRTVVNLIDGEADVCLRSTGACRSVRAGDQPLAATRNGFGTAGQTEAASLWRALDTAHLSLDRRIGVDPTGAQQSASVRESARAASGGGSFGVGPISSSVLVPGLSTFAVIDPIALPSVPAGTAPIAVPTNAPGAPIVVVPPASPGTPAPSYTPPIGPSPFSASATEFIVQSRSSVAFPTSAGPTTSPGSFVPAGDVTFDTAQALRSFTLPASAFTSPSGIGPYTVTRGTASATDVYNGLGGGQPIFQIGAWRDGSVYYNEPAAGASGAVAFGPNQAFHYITSISSNFDPTPTRQTLYGNLFTYSLEAATRPTWSDGRSAPGTFSGTMSFGVGSLALYFGLSGTLSMAEGVFTLQTPGGASNPYASSLFNVRTANSSLIGIGTSNGLLLSGPGVNCPGLCGAAGITLLEDRLLLTYDAPVTPGGASLQGVAAFQRTGAAQGAQFAGFGAGFQDATLDPPRSGLATGLVEGDLTLSSINLTSGGARSRDPVTSTVFERGSSTDSSGVPVLAWERWTGTVTDGTNSVNLSADQGLHVIHGLPATNIPTNTLLSYNLVGATKPTIGDGSLAAGTLTSGSLGVLFGPNVTSSRVGVNLAVSIGGGNYAIQTNGGATNPAASAIALLADGRFNSGGQNVGVTGAGTVCPTGCTASIDGFLAGNGARNAGLIYQFQDPASAPFISAVTGAAAFKAP